MKVICESDVKANNNIIVKPELSVLQVHQPVCPPISAKRYLQRRGQSSQSEISCRDLSLFG